MATAVARATVMPHDYEAIKIERHEVYSGTGTPFMTVTVTCVECEGSFTLARSIVNTGIVYRDIIAKGWDGDFTGNGPEKVWCPHHKRPETNPAFILSDR